MTALIGEFSGKRYTVRMINMILTLSLSLLNAQPATQTAQFRPCVWPNLCRTQPAPIIEIAPAVEVAQFTTCLYPRTCAKRA